LRKVEIKLIDRKVVKAQQNKMAGGSGESGIIFIYRLKENAMKKEKKKTLYKAQITG